MLENMSLQNLMCDNDEIRDSHGEYLIQQLTQENLPVNISKMFVEI